AYGAREYQFVGAPGWARTERFEINLTPDRVEDPLSPNWTPAQFDGWRVRNSQRMQAVLYDRFGLVIRKEIRELPTYGLTVAKNGHKLTTPAQPNRGMSLNINNGQLINGRSTN